MAERSLESLSSIAFPNECVKLPGNAYKLFSKDVHFLPPVAIVFSDSHGMGVSLFPFGGKD